MTETKSVERRIADAFLGKLEQELTKSELQVIAERNRKYELEGKKDTCATHEFLDPNVLMNEAFIDIFGRDALGDDPDDDATILSDIELWSKAWSKAKKMIDATYGD